MRAKAGKASGFFASKARDVLNPSTNNQGPAQNLGGFDLLAWNINRGRDHGLPRNSKPTFSIFTKILSNIKGKFSSQFFSKL